MKDIRTAFEESGIGKKWNELWKKVTEIWNKAWPIIKEKWDFFWGIVTAVLDVAGTLIGTDIRNIVEDLEGMAKYLPSFGDVVSFIFGLVLGVIVGVTTPIVGALHGIATAIDWMRQVLDHFAPFWAGFADAWKEATWIEKGSLIIDAALTAVAEVVAIVLAAISGFVYGFVEGVITFFKMLANELVGQSIVPEMMKAIYNTITTIFQNVLTWIGTKLTELATAFSTKATEIKTALAAAWAEIQTTASTIWTDITTALTTKAGEIYAAITTKITELQTWWGTTWGSIRDTLGGIWTEITSAATTKIAEVVTAVAGGVQDTLDAVATFVTKFYTAGSDLIGGMVQGVLDAIAGLIAAVVKAIKDALDAARDFLEAFSPSKKTMRLGFDFIEGFRLPIEMEGAALIGTLDRALKPLLGGMARLPDMSARAALAPAPVLGGGSTTNNYYNSNAFDFGRNQVGSPADLARMEMMVTRVVRKELRRR